MHAEPVARTESPPGNVWLRKLFELGIVAAITLGILEAILRGLGLTHPILYIADEHAGYRLKPDQQVGYLGNTIAINDWGIRDARDLVAGAGGADRILVLGDSVTWGGVRESQQNLFTSVLESNLPGTEVINCGVNGYSVTQMVELYTHHLRPLNPGRILVFAIPRDFTRPAVSRLTGAGVAFPQHAPRSAVLAAMSLARNLAADRWNWAWMRPLPAAIPDDPDATMEDSLERNLNALSGLRAAAGSDRLLVVLLPTAPGSPDVDKMERIEEELRRRNIPFENMADHTTYRAEYFVDGIHLTTEGHRVVGTILADILSVDR